MEDFLSVPGKQDLFLDDPFRLLLHLRRQKIRRPDHLHGKGRGQIKLQIRAAFRTRDPGKAVRVIDLLHDRMAHHRREDPAPRIPGFLQRVHRQFLLPPPSDALVVQQAFFQLGDRPHKDQFLLCPGEGHI